MGCCCSDYELAYEIREKLLLAIVNNDHKIFGELMKYCAENKVNIQTNSDWNPYFYLIMTAVNYNYSEDSIKKFTNYFAMYKDNFPIKKYQSGSVYFIINLSGELKLNHYNYYFTDNSKLLTKPYKSIKANVPPYILLESLKLIVPVDKRYVIDIICEELFSEGSVQQIEGH